MASCNSLPLFSNIFLIGFTAHSVKPMFLQKSGNLYGVSPTFPTKHPLSKNWVLQSWILKLTYLNNMEVFRIKNDLLFEICR